MLMRGAAPIPTEGGVPLADKTTEEVYQETCVDWPQNIDKINSDTGRCCWQLVEDGDRKKTT